MPYKNWANGEPNNAFSRESCISLMNMAWWNGRWNDDDCTKEKHFICEVDD
jgi:Lectin C-type domain